VYENKFFSIVWVIIVDFNCTFNLSQPNSKEIASSKIKSVACLGYWPWQLVPKVWIQLSRQRHELTYICINIFIYVHNCASLERSQNWKMPRMTLTLCFWILSLPQYYASATSALCFLCGCDNGDSFLKCAALLKIYIRWKIV